VRIASLVILFLMGASTLDAAPAPQFKGLPEEVENMVRGYTVGTPHSIESVKQDIRTARTEEERGMRVRHLELLQWERYTMPVVILQNVLTDPRYQSHRDQEAIRRALEKHRQSYLDARRMGLFKPEPPDFTDGKKRAGESDAKRKKRLNPVPPPVN
jgi:hypothetical protein